MTAVSRQRVAMSGFGSVGQSLARILEARPDLPITLTAVADRRGYAANPMGLQPRALLAAKQQGSVALHPYGRKGTIDAAVLEGCGAEVFVEAASTSFDDGQPGWEYVQTALAQKLDVVLASKGPLVAHWDELHRRVEESGSRLRFSATHGAPLPAVEFATTALRGSRLRSIRALFNSTTGLLLEEMEQGRSLTEALERIGQAGVAETNPRLDVEGWDAAAKCVIVGRSVFGGRMELGQVDRTGIQGLSISDVQAASQSGGPIKLVSRIRPGDHGPEAIVSPEPLSPSDPLAALRRGALGIVYEAEPIGDLFVAAYGSGGEPTAAAVIRDVLSVRVREPS